MQYCTYITHTWLPSHFQVNWGTRRVSCPPDDIFIATYMFDFEFPTWGVYAYMGHIVLEEYYAQICNQNPQDPKCYVSGAAL